ncbi:MAG: S8 family serine peptidase [Verrucomicrobiota bacterium]
MPPAAANAAVTNAASPFPYRLQNTTQPLEQLVRNDHAILLRNALIDTSLRRMEIPAELRSKGDPGSYIVQARGVIDASFRAALLSAKAEIVSYVPNNAFLVRVGQGGAERLLGNKSVQSVLRYEPYYKLDSDLLASVMEKQENPAGTTVRVTLFPGEKESAIKALKGKGSVVSEDLTSSPFGPELIVGGADLVALANLKQVQGIESFGQRTLLNDLTRVRLGVSTNPVTPNNYLDLGGTNIWVNVNDTPIDNGHPDLAGRIFPATGVGMIDTDGHGTHVTGIIASSGVNGPTNAPRSAVGANFRGQAPGVNILSQDIFAGLSDAKLQTTAAETNFVLLNRKSPLISNNSWGYGTHSYNSSSASFDAAVRDALPTATGSQPIIYVFAAGNDGGGNNNGQSGFSGSVVSPGNAKNVITVGALENLRNITNEVIRPNINCVIRTNKEFFGLTDSSSEVAFFSSRGNVGVSQEGAFGRMKPDIIAPGTFIVSTRSRQFNEASYYSPLHEEVQPFPGLTLDPRATNHFSILIPDNPCNRGATLSLTIDTFNHQPAGSPLFLYASTTPNPSGSAGNLVGTDTVTFNRGDPKLPLNAILYYDIANTNNFEVNYQLQTRLVLSNDFGSTTNGYFQVLSNLNETLKPNYRFESGTSMAAPAISGMLALMQEFFETRFQITNSPAMMKALLINGARAVGDYNYEKERSLNIEGWGLPNLQTILPTNTTRAAWPIQLFDQDTNTALATGQRTDRVVTVNDTNSPLRITLVWTDPPGNPAVGVKLVNDLDLMVTEVTTDFTGTNAVTNVYFGNNFAGGEFTQATDIGTNVLGDFDAIRDTVNNVENVYINGPVGAQLTVSVVARRVNVNAVTAHTNGIVQDYALVISSGNLAQTATPFTVTTNASPIVTPGFPVNVISNGVSVFNQRVGANSPLQQIKANNLTDGTNTQWAFYVFNNPSNFNNIAFLTFLPPNLSGATNTVPGSRRILEADIDLYVSTDPSLTNLNPAAIAGADKSLKRGGQELIVYTNRSDPVFYVGIKSEDQRAAEFSFFAVATGVPFSRQDANGNVTIDNMIPIGGIPIPDGAPDKPGGTNVLLIAIQPINIARVIVTNTFTHERIGDLINTLDHDNIAVILHNHSFPGGLESGTFTGIYDDAEFTGSDLIPGSRHTDGPGNLTDFIESDGFGMWQLTLADSSQNATGRVDFFSIFLERALDTNAFPGGGGGFILSPTQIPPNSSRGLSFVVPPNATNMIISISPKEGPIDTVVRQGRALPTRAAPGGPYVDKGLLIAPPGASFNVDKSDNPPLQPGRYSLRLFNDTPSAITVSGVVRFELDLTAASFKSLKSSGPSVILDDAVTDSIIHVDRDAMVTGVEVGVRIDHPRVSDLVLHLVSPSGTRILLAENRGGLSATNGYGVSALTTNVIPVTSNGDATPQTNIISTPLNSGILQIDYDFFDVPDQMQIYYDTLLIYDTGLINGAGSLTIPFGPGIDTNVFIVMNGNGNPNPVTAWTYTVTALSGEIVHATFSDNTNLALVPIKFAIPPFATNLLGTNFFITTLIQNPSFESDLTGWTANNAGVVISPFVPSTFPTTDGTKAVELGINDISGSILSQNFSAVGGTTYLLSFDLTALGDPGRVSVLQVEITNALGTLVSDTFTNNARNTLPIPFETKFLRFTVPVGQTNLTLRFIDLSPSGGVAVDAIIDNIQLPSQHSDPNYYQPEEPLSNLIGQNSQGDWRLEIWDNRAGQPLGAAVLRSWQLNLNFASTNALAGTVTNGMPMTNTVSGAEIKYFIVDVPLFATTATNVLISTTGGPLNLWFNQNQLPLGNPAFGDVTLLSSVVNGTKVLTTTSFPTLQPGERYYLGVQNVSAAQTNSFTLTVTFDSTNNLVNVTPLMNAIPLSTNLPLATSIEYFQYDLTNSVSNIVFEVRNLSGDADMVERLNRLPTQAVYEYSSTAGGTNNELITIPFPVPGRYYLGVYGFFPTNAITYTIIATEGATVVLPIQLFNPMVVGTQFQVMANTIIGKTYVFEYTTDFVTWMTISSAPATMSVTTFVDPTFSTAIGSRFYRVRQLP